MNKPSRNHRQMDSTDGDTNIENQHVQRNQSCANSPTQSQVQTAYLQPER